MGKQKGQTDSFVRIVLPLHKKFKNGEYMWQDTKNIGIYIEGWEEPLFLSKASINGEIEKDDKSITIWITRRLACKKKIEQFEDSSHMPSLWS